LNAEQSNKTRITRPTIIYLFVGLIAFIIRLYFNFSQELIPGVNGGYYPVQVRTILTQGSVGFSDMPLVFYLDAYLVKFLTLFELSISDALILNVVKVVDSLAIPILLIPLYKIISNENTNLSKPYEIGVACFSVLSFSPLILTSDLQKNALAIVFLFCFLGYFISYQNKRKYWVLISAIVCLTLTGLTHFGTFCFLLFYLMLFVGFIYKRKAVVPLMVILSISLALIAFFDISRLKRLFSIGTLAFERPALTNGMLAPPDIFVILISIILAILGFKVLKDNKRNLLMYQKGLLFANIICLITLSFPLLDGEYFKRLSLFLFIPQILTIILIHRSITKRVVISLYISLFILTTISIIAVISHKKETVIDEVAYQDLKQLKSIIKKDNKTIVIARHGLEWWAAWALDTKVGQDKAMTDDFYTKYKNIFIINQYNGNSTERQRTQFHEPFVPQNSEMIYSSKYFYTFKLNFQK
jgi:fumarate reductase subunit C